MSHQANKWVIPMEMSAPEKVVMLVLAYHADKHGNDSYPGMATMVRETGLKDRGIQRIITRLCEQGFLSVGDREGGRGRKTNYSLASLNPDAGSVETPTLTPTTGKETPTPTTINPDPDDINPDPDDIDIEEGRVHRRVQEESIITSTTRSTRHPGRDFEMPEEFKPLTTLDGYTKRNHSKAIEGITSACSAAGVDVAKVVEDFAEYYRLHHVGHGWSDPVKSLRNSRVLNIQISQALKQPRASPSGNGQQPTGARSYINSGRKFQ